MSLGEELQQLETMTRAAARAPEWVQASGGNTSIKDEASGRLSVKASGLRFDEATAAEGFVTLDLKGVRALLDDASYDGMPFTAQQDRAGAEMAPLVLEAAEGMRPSLETGFHSLGGRCAVHTHPIAVAAGLSMEGGRELLLKELGGLGGGAVWADLRPPGYSLARVIRAALAEKPQASLVLMENHGLLAYADTPEQAVELTAQAVARCEALFGVPKPPVLGQNRGLLNRVAALLGKLLTESLGADEAVTAVADDPWAASHAAGAEWTWQPVCADDVIFCGLKVPLLSPTDAVDDTRLDGLYPDSARRAVLAVKGLGVVMAAPNKKALDWMQEMLHANARARAMTRLKGRTRALPPQVCVDVAGMEGEKYRQNLPG
jgi:ribulose-5-phosphate 4-epimerase/fuculose-1-phosphate aldolase